METINKKSCSLQYNLYVGFSLDKIDENIFTIIKKNCMFNPFILHFFHILKSIEYPFN